MFLFSWKRINRVWLSKSNCLYQCCGSVLESMRIRIQLFSSVSLLLDLDPDPHSQYGLGSGNNNKREEVKKFVVVRLSPERTGPLGKAPSMPRSSTFSRTSSRLHAVTLLLSETQCWYTQYECGRMQPLLCSNSDQQVSSGQNLRRLRQINNNYDIHETQSLIISSKNNHL
jgi:hypothetical protein